MKTFREYINEANNKPTVGNVKKFIKSIDFSVILPEYFSISEHKYSGGGKGIKVQWDTPRVKDEDDIELMIKSIEKEYSRVEYTQKNTYLMVLTSKN